MNTTRLRIEASVFAYQLRRDKPPWQGWFSFYLPAIRGWQAKAIAMRHAAWLKDNEAFIPQQRDEAFRPVISRPENDFLYSCPFACPVHLSPFMGVNWGEHSWNRFFSPCA
jgi:hypothetical protein